MTARFMAILFVVSFFLICGTVNGQDTVSDTSPEVEEFAGKTYVCEKCGVSLDEPGKCPTCGNDLVEEKVTDKETEETPEAPVSEETPAPKATK